MKKITLILLLTIFTFSLPSCSSDDDEDTNSLVGMLGLVQEMMRERLSHL